MTPFDIYLVPEEGKEIYLDTTVTPGGALTRMIDGAVMNGEKVLSVTPLAKAEGSGHIVESETYDGKVVARTSIFRK